MSATAPKLPEIEVSPEAPVCTESSTDNHPRFVPGNDHVESWFLRANHPTEPLALWLKVTILGRSDRAARATEGGQDLLVERRHLTAQ